MSTCERVSMPCTLTIARTFFLMSAKDAPRSSGRGLASQGESGVCVPLLAISCMMAWK